MGHYLLIYDLADDYLDRRADYRAEHLALTWTLADRGTLLLGGALDDPVDQAMLLFSADSQAVVEAFVAVDPYVTNGLVRGWRIRPWTTVVGAEAATPVRF